MKQGFDLEFGVRAVIVAASARRRSRRTACVLLLGAAPYAGVALAQDAAAAPTAAAEALEAQATPGEAVPAPAESAAAPAVAEDVSSGIEEVLVTARRREESAQSVPIAITALGASALEELHIENLDDLATVVPTLSVSAASGRPNAPVYSLRGIRPTEAIYGQDPTVAIYFGDVVMSPAEGSNMGMYDLASVQVLKGPQGTLFGRNTTGGAVLLSPKRPGHHFASDVMVGYGSYGRSETQVGIDMPIADNFAVRLSGRTIKSEGYQTNVAANSLNGSKLGGDDTRSARLSALWNLSDSIENYTILSYDKRMQNGRGLVLQAVNPNTALRCYDGPGNPNTGGQPCPTETTALPSIFDALARAQSRGVDKIESDLRQRDDIDVWGVVNTTTIGLGDDLQLKSIAGYRDFETKSLLDIDSTQIPDILTSDQSATLQHASYELQLLGTALDKQLDWVTGVYYYYEDGYQNSPGAVLTAINPASAGFTQRGDIHNISYSGFAQGSYRFAPDWSLTAGARWTNDKKEMEISTHTNAGCGLIGFDGNRLPADACSIPLSKSFSEPTGTLSLDYRLRDGVLVYVASRRGYRAGGFNLRGSQPVQYQPFDPETVTDAELGTKTDWLLGDWQMRSNLAVYHQWYDDIQRTVAVPVNGAPSSVIQNAAKAKVLGLELEQTIKPTRKLTLQLNYAYTDPKYQNWTDPASGTDLSSTPFYFTPKHAASATLSYVEPLEGDAGALQFSASGSYKSDTWINALQTSRDIAATPDTVRPLLQQDAYWLLDMSAAWTEIMGSKMDVSAYVKNVTDEQYAVGGVQLYTSFGLLARAYGEPRTVGMQLRYRF